MAKLTPHASTDFTQVGLHEAAAILGKSVVTLKSWFNLGCPVIERGGKAKKWRICPAAVIAWREEKIAQDSVGDTQNLDYEEARRREMAAKAAMLELDLAQRRGKLVEVELIADLVGEEYANVRARILGLPTRLAPQVIGITSLPELRALIEAGITEVLEELTADGIYSGYASTAEGDTEEEGDES
jgi:terminase small subunit / prophage DNA-packing protein